MSPSRPPRSTQYGTVLYLLPCLLKTSVQRFRFFDEVFDEFMPPLAFFYRYEQEELVKDGLGGGRWWAGGIHTEMARCSHPRGAGGGTHRERVGRHGGAGERCLGRPGTGNDVLWRWRNGGLVGDHWEVTPGRGR